eukprot:2688561-Rhodomonas_salina.2
MMVPTVTVTVVFGLRLRLRGMRCEDEDEEDEDGDDGLLAHTHRWRALQQHVLVQTQLRAPTSLRHHPGQARRHVGVPGPDSSPKHGAFWRFPPFDATLSVDLHCPVSSWLRSVSLARAHDWTHAK